MLVKKAKTIETHNYDNADYKNWIDFSNVRKDFNYSLFLHSMSSCAHEGVTLLYTIPQTTISIIINIIFFINYSPILILQAVLTQPENDSPSFFACCWINSSKSSSKRIVCLVLFKRSFLFLVFFSCIGAVHCDKLHLTGAVHYNDEYHEKQSPEVLAALSRDLTQPLS